MLAQAVGFRRIIDPAHRAGAATASFTATAAATVSLAAAASSDASSTAAAAISAITSSRYANNI